MCWWKFIIAVVAIAPTLYYTCVYIYSEVDGAKVAACIYVYTHVYIRHMVCLPYMQGMYLQTFMCPDLQAFTTCVYTEYGN